MRLFTTLALLLPALLLASCATSCCEGCETDAECQLPAEEGGTAWRSLFDGETTTGWRNYGKDDISDGWKVIDGALTMTGGGGDIVTVDTFGDFEFELEWQVSEAGNSGIFYNVQAGQNAVWATGPEMQVLDNAKHQDGKNPFTSAGSCYALYQPARDVTRPIGEWNQVRILHADGHVEHWLNGVKLCEFDLGSEEWNRLVKASKFSSMPEFGKYRTGHIALQDHSDWVAYRNIRIREL